MKIKWTSLVSGLWATIQISQWLYETEWELATVARFINEVGPWLLVPVMLVAGHMIIIAVLKNL